MILPKEATQSPTLWYPKSDTAVPKVRHCGTQSPTLRVPPQQKASRGCQEATPIDYNLLRKKITN